MSDTLYRFPVDLKGADIEPYRKNWTMVKAEGFQDPVGTVVEIADKEVKVKIMDPNHPLAKLDTKAAETFEVVPGLVGGAPTHAEMEDGADPADERPTELVELTLRRKPVEPKK